MSEIILNPNKKSITFDGLDILTNSLASHMEDIVELPESTPTNTLRYLGYIARIPPAEQEYENFLKFNWAHGTNNNVNTSTTTSSTTTSTPANEVRDESINIVQLNELEQIDFTNNLDSLIDYADGFQSFSLQIVYGLIETIRVHFGSNKVLFVGTDISIKRKRHIYLQTE